MAITVTQQKSYLSVAYIVVYSSGNALQLYSRGIRFESQRSSNIFWFQGLHDNLSLQVDFYDLIPNQSAPTLHDHVGFCFCY
jgi:hypothetical protein